MFARFTIAEPEPSAIKQVAGSAFESAAALSAREDIVHAKGWMGFPFDAEPAEPGEPADLRLVAVSAVGPSRSALSEAWSEVGEAFGDAVPRFDVEAELVRAFGDGWGPSVRPTTDTPASLDEPVLVVITGDVHPQHLDAFVAAGRPVVAQAQADPSYLGGCGLASSQFDITSFSCWRSARAARKFGFAAGAHRTAMDADQAGSWHDLTTSVYATFRVLAARGTLLGDSPFSAVSAS